MSERDVTVAGEALLGAKVSVKWECGRGEYRWYRGTVTECLRADPEKGAVDHRITYHEDGTVIWSSLDRLPRGREGDRNAGYPPTSVVSVLPVGGRATVQCKRLGRADGTRIHLLDGFRR